MGERIELIITSQRERSSVETLFRNDFNRAMDTPLPHARFSERVLRSIISNRLLTSGSVDIDALESELGLEKDSVESNIFGSAVYVVGRNIAQASEIEL